MENCLGIINNYNIDDRMGQLTDIRPTYMIPFAGRYRIIDIPMSNMVNNGIKKVAVITGAKIRSALDHLGSGSAWNLNSRFQGLHLFPPQPQETGISRLGDLKDFYTMKDFFDRSKHEYVFICDNNVIFKDNMRDIYNNFIESESDITLIYKRVSDPEGNYLNADKLHVNLDNEVMNLGINLGTEVEFNLFINAFFIKKDVLMEILDRVAEKGNAFNIRDAIAQNLSFYNVTAAETDGYFDLINDIKGYYDANLRLLDEDNFYKFFYDQGMISTRTKDEPPTTYKDMENLGPCLIANGCKIDGDVESSVIYRAVKIGEGAIVRNSIIMEKTIIEPGAVVINSIIDRNCLIEENANLIGSINEPYVLGRGQRVGANN